LITNKNLLIVLLIHSLSSLLYELKESFLINDFMSISLIQKIYINVISKVQIDYKYKK
jgi:hypothetical protein